MHDIIFFIFFLFLFYFIFFFSNKFLAGLSALGILFILLCKSCVAWELITFCVVSSFISHCW